MKVIVASDQDREELFAEIHHDDQPWAEIILDPGTGKYVLTVFSSGESNLTFPLQEVEDGIATARAALAARGYAERE